MERVGRRRLPKPARSPPLPFLRRSLGKNWRLVRRVEGKLGGNSAESRIGGLLLRAVAYDEQGAIELRARFAMPPMLPKEQRCRERRGRSAAARRMCRFPLHALRLKLGARIVNRRGRMADLAFRLRAVVRNEAAAAEEVIRFARHGHDSNYGVHGHFLPSILHFLPILLPLSPRPVCE